MVVIRASNIVKEYKIGTGILRALDGVSLNVERGDFIAIMGPSGSGKSTLLNILGCLDRPSSGDYELDGIKTTNLNDRELSIYRNRKIGFVFQLFYLLPREDVFHNVELPLLYARIRRSERRKRVEEVLYSVGLLDRLRHKPDQLSGGERQRVAIARALVNRPSLLLADEPTGNLDSRSGHEIMRIFKTLNEQENTIILVTHNEEMAKYAKRIIHLKDGRISECGSISQLE